MKVKVLRPLRGDYGSVVTGQIFQARQDLAADLIKRGLACELESGSEVEPEIETEIDLEPEPQPRSAQTRRTKVTGPSETKAQ